jgi:hypothetical protein
MDPDSLRCKTPIEFRDHWHNVRDKIHTGQSFTDIHDLLSDAFSAGETSAMIMREEPVVDSWGLEGRAPLRTRLRREYLVQVITCKIAGKGEVGEEICRGDYVFYGASSISMSHPHTEVHLQNEMGGDSLFSLLTGNELDFCTHQPKKHAAFNEHIAPEDLRLLRIRCGRDDLNQKEPLATKPQLEKKVVTGKGCGVMGFKSNGWLIERRKAHSAPWTQSTLFPLYLSYSAIEFFVYELARLRQRRATVTKPFEGIALVMIVEGVRITIAKVAVGFDETTKNGAHQ